MNADYVEIMIKRLQDIPLPKYMTEYSVGMDICAAVNSEVVLMPGERALIPTGIAVAIPIGFEAQIRPRSGLAIKYGVTMLNSPGTIDPDYRGEVKLILINLGDKPFRIRRGDRIAQMVINKIACAEIKEVNELPSTKRGKGGFGHTGGYK